MWVKMEGKPLARSGAAGCSIDIGNMRHMALTIRDALIETYVTDSESY